MMATIDPWFVSGASVRIGHRSNKFFSIGTKLSEVDRAIMQQRRRQNSSIVSIPKPCVTISAESEKLRVIKAE